MAELSTIIPSTWDRAGLELAGFVGWTTLVGIRAPVLPTEHGVYVVLRESLAERVYLERNPAQRGTRGTAYSVDDLASKWVPDASVVYIGKAAGSRGLRSRLVPFGRKATNHSGGRSIWQLADANDLIVAWCAHADAARAETALIAAFIAKYGRLPFANRRG